MFKRKVECKAEMYAVSWTEGTDERRAEEVIIDNIRTVDQC